MRANIHKHHKHRAEGINKQITTYLNNLSSQRQAYRPQLPIPSVCKTRINGACRNPNKQARPHSNTIPTTITNLHQTRRPRAYLPRGLSFHFNATGHNNSATSPGGSRRVLIGKPANRGVKKLLKLVDAGTCLELSSAHDGVALLHVGLG